VPDPPTKRETTSTLLPVFGVPLKVELWLFAGDSEAWDVPGVAVANDILVVLYDGVRCNRRSVIAFASAAGLRAAYRSSVVPVAGV
jgi:hypothetical protein